jgi:hypothetical protein
MGSTSKDETMLELELRKFMRHRCDGFWELLATAAGEDESVRKTVEGLSAQALASEVSGPAISPTWWTNGFRL